MSAQQTKHILAFNSKLNHFRATGKYCDVTIRVQEKSFICHRLALTSASEYFDIMFGGNFREGNVNSVTLNLVEAAAFEEVLRFAYTGEVQITFDNLSGVWRASEYFKLIPVEEVCLRYIRVNKNFLPIPNMLEIFMFACLTNKHSLIDELSEHIVKNFDVFCKHEKFLELSFDELMVLGSQRWYLPPSKNVTLLNAIIVWINHSRQERAAYCGKLMEIFDFSSFPSELYVRNALKKFTPSSLSMDGEYAFLERVARNSSVKLMSKDELALHVFLYGENNETPNRETSGGQVGLRVLSTGRSFPNSWTMSRSFDVHCRVRMKCVGSEADAYRYLYCLDYHRSRNNSFYAYSVSNSSLRPRALELPPISVSNFDLCSMQDTVYLTHRNHYSENVTYVYNIKLDKWFPLPRTKISIYNACLTVLNNTLYLIGEGGSLATSLSKSVLQTYDIRTSQWQVLSNSTTYTHNIYNQCCGHKGKIYVTNRENPNRVDVYNPVSGHWENTSIPVNDLLQFNRNSNYLRKLISYENWLWAFDQRLNVYTYNNVTCKWSAYPKVNIRKALDRNYFRDVVVLKKFGQ